MEDNPSKQVSLTVMCSSPFVDMLSTDCSFRLLKRCDAPTRGKNQVTPVHGLPASRHLVMVMLMVNQLLKNTKRLLISSVQYVLGLKP